MKLQALTVSVNYPDFLVHVLEENKSLFDKWIIVTDTKDEETFNLCQKYSKYGIVCIQTDSFYENAIFNKYAGINVGLNYIDLDSWCLFLDSDIILHDQTRRILENLELNKEFIYGIDRVNCKGIDSWEGFKAKRNLVIDNWLLTNAGFDLGSRLVHYYGYAGGDGKFKGWNPLGFFQLAHRGSFSSYPAESEGADHCDLVFSRNWPRSKRQFIPEIIGIHLESEFLIKGTNWYGRISLPFDKGGKKLTISYLFKLIKRYFLIREKGVKRKIEKWIGKMS